ncbi:MAG TPA: Na+/H+ antiporter NhaA, partial [Mycobacterium sp.]|nr:Na+/H+ antiporter NhaA [Mycobacterium sp.]
MANTLSDNRFRRAAQRVLFARGSWAETSRMSSVLRKETVGGALLLCASAVALLWANSAWSPSYHALSGWRVGVERFGLNLSLSSWAAEGLLAIFFFVVGVELKREFVAGDLRDPSRAALPIAAAIGGMVVPAVIFVAMTAHAGAGVARGWAIPTATDIAFAVAVLAVISTHLPSALRTFLLTLAVVDDLLAITVIAVFYTERIHLAALGLALIPLLAFGLCVRRNARWWWVLLPLAAATWVLVHESGVHATVAGVALGFTVPASAADDVERCVHPISAGVAVPVFAFFAAGVTVGGYDGLVSALTDPITLGVVAGLVVGKTVGVFGTARALAAMTRAR